MHDCAKYNIRTAQMALTMRHRRKLTRNLLTPRLRKLGSCSNDLNMYHTKPYYWILRESASTLKNTNIYMCANMQMKVIKSSGTKITSNNFLML